MVDDSSISVDGGTPDGSEPGASGEIADLLAVAAGQLLDEYNVSWPISRLLPYLTYFTFETVNLKPEAYPVEETIQLVAGPRQDLPTTAISILNALYNVSGSGSTEIIIAPAITMISKGALDHLLPGWITETSATTVTFVVTDDLNPKAFFVYPPQSSSPGAIKLLLSEAPDPIGTTTTEFPFDVSYKPVAVDYVIYRALNEENSIPNAQAKSTAHYNKFLQGLGLKTQAEKKTEAQGR